MMAAFGDGWPTAPAASVGPQQPVAVFFALETWPGAGRSVRGLSRCYMRLSM